MAPSSRPTASGLTGQYESSLAPKNVVRDSVRYLGPAVLASLVLLFVGPRWLKELVAAVDVLFALMMLAAVTVAVRIWRVYGRRHDVALFGYGLYLLALPVLAVVLFIR